MAAVTGSATGATVGGVIGKLASSGNNSNLYYYTGTAAAGIGNPGSYTDNTAALTDSMKDTFLTAINNNGAGRSFVADLPGENAINNGWPILRFQTGSDTTTVTSLSITALPAKTAYIETQTFQPDGMAVMANYSDGTSEPVLLYSYPKEPLVGGTTSVTIGYGGKTVEVPITVAYLQLTSLVISTAPANTYYAVGDSFDQTGMVLTAYFNNTTAADANRVCQVLAATDYTVTPETLSAGDTFVTISYTHHGHDGDVTITVDQAITVIAVPSQDEDGYYLIQTVSDLQWFANQVSVLGNAGINARLAGNIDLTGVAWTPVGASANPFKGTFDGNNKAITGFDNNNTTVTAQYYGLIGYADGATVKDLSVTANLTGGANYTSAIVAYAKGGSTLTNLTANGTITKIAGSYNGGIAGSVIASTVSDCVNNLVISGNGSQAGGIVGSMGAGCTIDNCTNNGEINMTSNWAGGISGYNGTAAESTASVIKNCTNNAKITGGSNCGGIAGQNFAYQYIKNCANLADVTSTNTYAGGIAGRVSVATAHVKASYNTGRISCKQSTGGIVGYNAGAITDCYNLGAVDDYTSGGTASHGIGGIAGTSATSAITNTYNAGAVTRTNETVHAGGVVGLLNSGSTANSYYLAGTAAAGVGSGTDTTAVKTSDELEALAPVLGEGFQAGSAYPILAWQGTAGPTVYTVTADSAITGGSLALSPTSGAAGDTVTVTVHPDSDKHLVAGSLKYTADNGATYTEITAAGGVYSFVLPAADVTVTARFEDSSPAPKYTVTPTADEAVYEVGETPGGISIMTVKAGVSGLKYFGVQTNPVTSHAGKEAMVFVHLRNDIQLSLNITKADFDLVNKAQSGFNVQTGDIVKVFIVDDLTNDVNHNPILLQ
ncbi:MAG TPA: hypothetical protein DCZ10_06090, partial [Pelotomaculum sp.]|nr:hypothetical protein [Pelotomaculum sp.]